jgi:hypothetical protein
VPDELMLGGKPAQIRPIFADHRLNCFHANAIDPGQVHPADAEQLTRYAAEMVNLSWIRPTCVLRQWSRIGSSPLFLIAAAFCGLFGFGALLPAALLPLHLRQFPQNLLFVVGDPFLNRIVHSQGLPQAEQVVCSPMPAQLLSNFLLALPATRIPKLRQFPSIPLSANDGSHNGQPGHAVDVRDRWPQAQTKGLPYPGQG